MANYSRLWLTGIFLFLTVVFLYNFSVAANVECEVTGKVVMWENDNLLDKCIIKVYKDTELVAQSISDKGKYYLKFPCGKYTFVVIYIDKDGEKYVDEKKVNLVGNTTFDFMVTPYLNFSELEYEISELETNFSKFEEDGRENNKSDENLIAIILVSLGLIILVAFVLIWLKKSMKNKKNLVSEKEGVKEYNKSEKEKYERKEGNEIKTEYKELKKDDETKNNGGDIKNAVSEEIKAAEKTQTNEDNEGKDIRKNEEKTKIKITQGMENVMKALTYNERVVVRILLEHDCMLRRNEIARGTGISKSSLAAALTKLEEKKIVEIDRTFIVHNVKLTNWFRSL